MEHSESDRRIDYVEFGVADIERAKAFYGRAFGWTFTDYGPTYCEFSDGRLTGGFTTGEPPRPGGPLVILYGDDLAVSSAASKPPGGGSRSRSSISPAGSASILSTPTATNWRSGRSARRLA